MICPNCKKEINEGTKFCMFCGAPVSAVSAPADKEKTVISVAEQPRQNDLRPGQVSYQQPPYRQTLYQQTPYQQAYRMPPENGQNRQNSGNAEKVNTEKKKSNMMLTLSIVLAILMIVILVLVMALTGVLDGLGSKERGKNKGKTESSDTLDEESAEVGESVDTESLATESLATESNAPESMEIEEGPSVTLSFGTYPLDTKMLDLSDVQVDSLEGIEQLTELETIIIRKGSLSDVSPLAALSDLKTIVLNNVPVTDILPLTGLDKLETLNIVDTQVNSENADAFLMQTVSLNLTMESYTEVRYTIVKQPLSWTEADIAAGESGGHLAVINSEEEFIEVTGMLNESGLIYVWLGAWYENGAWHTVTGEPFDYAKWYPGEPSGQDNDGTVEDKLCIWYLDGSWTENDQRDDLNTFLGSGDQYLGYLVEQELPTGIAPRANQ